MITTGDIVKVPFPYLESPENLKVRYALVISNEEFHNVFGERRYIVAFISSAIPPYFLEGWEFVIEEGTELFRQSGLKKTSVIKAHRIFEAQENIIEEVVGKVPLSLVKEIREKAIKKMFGL